LLVDKQVAVYLILGSNNRRPGWGNLKDKYDIEPLKYSLRKELNNLNNDYRFKLFFTDVNRNGDFHMKISYFPKVNSKINVEIIEDSSRTEQSKISESIKVPEKPVKGNSFKLLESDSE
jgi:hypothetical protein